MFHKHDWELIETNHISPTNRDIEDGGIKGRGNVAAIAQMYYREMGYLALGYYSYVFKCSCGDVKVTRS